MTISRAVKELLSFKIITVVGLKEKSIRFIFKGKDLWFKILPILRSPVRDIWFVDQIMKDNLFRIGGETALSSYTMLAGSNLKTYVVGKDEFRSMKELGSLKNLDKKNGDYKIEVWLYNPVILSQQKEVDKLSLFLSFKDEDDERTVRALQDLINEIQWL